jgi:3-oxo-5,6-didehydrosuberyl-CoA/3-oxoadipyl-CoA thiolase
LGGNVHASNLAQAAGAGYFLAMTRTAYLVDGLRTPFGRHGGALASVRADDMVGTVIAEVVKRTGIPAARIDDAIIGCANQAGEDNRNVARMGVLLAELPVEVPGITVNRLCGSGMQAFNDASRLILTGEADLVIAGGVEQMSRAPWVMGKPAKGYPRGNQVAHDTVLGWRFVNPRMDAMYNTLGMGLTAENVARRHQVSREDQDRFAHSSQQKAAAAWEAGHFADEVIPIVTGKNRKTGEEIICDKDEHPRPEVTLEKLARLKPVFDKQGTVTAGNASGINDGACAMVVASDTVVKELGLRPLARYVTSATAGVEPNYMGLGPIPASQKALERASLRASDIDVAELNEAFAAQALPCVRELGLEEERVNVNGGAIALGHPLGASGARLVITLAHEMRRRKSQYGLASMCIGVGQGIATVLAKP